MNDKQRIENIFLKPQHEFQKRFEDMGNIERFSMLTKYWNDRINFLKEEMKVPFYKRFFVKKDKRIEQYYEERISKLKDEILFQFDRKSKSIQSLIKKVENEIGNYYKSKKDIESLIQKNQELEIKELGGKYISILEMQIRSLEKSLKVLKNNILNFTLTIS